MNTSEQIQKLKLFIIKIKKQYKMLENKNIKLIQKQQKLQQQNTSLCEMQKKNYQQIKDLIEEKQNQHQIIKEQQKTISKFLHRQEEIQKLIELLKTETTQQNISQLESLSPISSTKSRSLVTLSQQLHTEFYFQEAKDNEQNEPYAEYEEEEEEEEEEDDEPNDGYSLIGFSQRSVDEDNGSDLHDFIVPDNEF